jgi:hypothetical protein
MVSSTLRLIERTIMTNTLLCHLHVVYGLYIVFVLWEQTHQNYCTTFLCGKPQMRESSLYSLILNSSHLQWTCVCVCVCVCRYSCSTQKWNIVAFVEGCGCTDDC